MKRHHARLLFSCVALAAAHAGAAEVRRLALVAGANQGRPERVRLHYAVADAERFAAVIQQLGGVDAKDALVLREPSRQAFLSAIGLVQQRAAFAHGSGERVEVVLYYSGHADEQGLMLGNEAVSYRELRDAIRHVDVDVGITVLDACASGVITRLKGGRPRPAFLTDESMRMQGEAFLTSSSENEVAQESEQLQGSFFTHALVSGLRGAADVSGDGKVTLGEAYLFAFQETLAQTTTTEGGAQHPAYDIRMAGTGDVVLTDVRRASAALVLGPELDGRFFVRDGNGRLIVELYKPARRRAEIAVEPGPYTVKLEQGDHLYSRQTRLAEGERRTIARSDLAPVQRTSTLARGKRPFAEPGRFALAGRTRLELSGLGGGVGSGGNVFDVSLGAVYWPREQIALEGTVAWFTHGRGSDYLWTWPYTRTNRELGLFFGARYYPPIGGRVRPFARLAFGPTAVSKTEFQPDGTSRDYTEGIVSSWLGAGVDCHLGPRFVLSARTGWEMRSGQRPDPTYGITLALRFGRPRTEPTR